MTRYFFHVVDGFRHLDRVGVELPDLAAARTEALLDITDIVQQKFQTVDLTARASWSIEICNEADQVLLVVPFSQN